jgi:hypothetical protein
MAGDPLLRVSCEPEVLVAVSPTVAPQESTMPSPARLSLAFLLVGAMVLPACNGSDGQDDDHPSVNYRSDLSGADQDGDTILDVHEGEADADGDGLPNYRDTDADGDGIDDATEAGDADLLTMPVDSDGDSVPDFLDDDSDDDGVADATERGSGSSAADTDGDGLADFRDADDDGDGISTEIENSARDTDHDGDGTPDYLDVDSDGDGVGDVWEAGTDALGADPVDTDGDGTPDYLDADSDNDGYNDSTEGGVSDGVSEPRDTDDDDRYDFEDTDADGDGLADDDEGPLYGTDPYDADTDGDGSSDGVEVAMGDDPLDPTGSTPCHGPWVDVAERSSVERDFSFLPMVEMADVAFLVDTTASMAGTITALASEFGTIVTELDGTLVDMAWGLAHHEDYHTGSMSTGADKPFFLQQQITTDPALVQAVLDATTPHDGGDAIDAQYEAIYQAASGMGYDMNCDRHYASEDDLYPFIASPDDPFDGGSGEWNDPTTPGGGSIGGYGFRTHALPILVHATDSRFRNGCAGDEVPGGCPQDACDTDAVGAMTDIGARYIGIDTSGPSGTSSPDMLVVSEGTRSMADTDGDGLVDDPLVFAWSGSSTELRDTIVAAVDELVADITFSKVALVIEGDDQGFVTNIDPPFYDDISPSDATSLEFSVSFWGGVPATTEDQVFILTFDLVGDGATLLDSYDVYVIVPGNGR